MMWKLIFLGIAIWLAIGILKRIAKHSGASRSKQDSDHGHIENMVQCATCSVHLPRSEAFLVNNQFYCCQAHIKK